ncbi:efflux RND transporter periplasmic adaptor subunit [Pseudoalteromonas lipolytica]|uniref:Efflux RND transporter periplasmic adaptor subunit n=1 Tax=Pseudoalteromonas lipolytica TaxID=570156 RepID=A0ABU8SZ18_9GAMM
MTNINTEQNGSVKVGRAKSLALTITAIVVIALASWGWKASRVSNTQWVGGAPVDVVTSKVIKKTTVQKLTVLGELRAVRQVSMSTEVSGQIREITFKAGQIIKAGEVLVQLDDSTEQADLVAAKAAASFAKQQLTRAKNLANTGATSKETLQQRQAESDQAEAKIQQLVARINKKRIVAPFDGVIGLRRVDLGQYLIAGDEVATLTDVDKLFVNFDIPQHNLSQVSIGQTIDVAIDVAESPLQTATVSAMETQVNTNTRNVTIQATMKNNQGVLKPGMYASVSIDLDPTPNSIVIPSTAIMTSPSGDSAVVVKGLSVDNIGKAEVVHVVVDRRDGDTSVIKSGLKEGDVVVTMGQLRIGPSGDVHVVSGDALSGGE